MELSQFLIKNEIDLSHLVLALCDEGIKLMGEGNVLHNATHVFRLFDNLDQFLKEEKTISKSEINFDVLLLAICWHDVWRAKKRPYSFLKWLPQMFWEGIGSMLVFRQRAKAVGLSKNLTRQTSYVIRKHSDFQILPRQALESRLFVDLDILDAWSLEKFELLKRHYLSKDNIHLAPLRFAKFYFDHIMSRASDKKLYCNWSRVEFNKRKRVYIAEVKKLVARYGKLL